MPAIPDALVVLQILADVAACVMVASLAARRIGLLAGAVAGVLLALHGPQIVFTTRVLDATLGAFLVAGLAVSCDRLERDARPRRFAVLGALVGLLALLRSTALAFVPVALAVGAWRWRRDDPRANALRGGALLLGVLLPIAPVTIRNLTAGGELVLLTSSGGVNFLIGNAPGSDGRFMSLNELPLAPGRFDDDPTGGRFEDAARRYAEARSGRPLTAAETSRFYSRQAREWIATDPLAWGRLLLRKLWLFLNAFEVPQVDNVYFLARYVPWLPPLSESSRVLWPLGLFGLLLAPRAAPPLLRAFFWSYAAAIALFFVTDRYRLWVTPIVAYFAGAAVAKLVAVARAGPIEKQVGHASALLVLVLACNLNPALLEPADVQLPPGFERGPPFGRSPRYLDFRAQHNNMAARCLELGDAEAARAECDAGLALAPDDPALALNLRRSLAALAPSLYQRGEWARARSIAERWTRAAPGDPEGWNTLGATLLKLEQTDSALDALRRAMVLAAVRAPGETRYRYNLGLALFRLERLAEAIPLLDAVLAAEPLHVNALVTRAEIHLGQGERDAARRLLERAAQRAPGSARIRELLERCGR